MAKQQFENDGKTRQWKFFDLATYYIVDRLLCYNRSNSQIIDTDNVATHPCVNKSFIRTVKQHKTNKKSELNQSILHVGLEYVLICLTTATHAYQHC